MEFPITGTVGLKPAWSAGEYLVGGEDAASSQFAVTLDNRPMAAHFELDNIDLMIAQWSTVRNSARQASQTLANARDKQIDAFIMCRRRRPRVWRSAKPSAPAPASSPPTTLPNPPSNCRADRRLRG